MLVRVSSGIVLVKGDRKHLIAWIIYVYLKHLENFAIMPNYPLGYL